MGQNFPNLLWHDMHTSVKTKKLTKWLSRSLGKEGINSRWICWKQNRKRLYQAYEWNNTIESSNMDLRKWHIVNNIKLHHFYIFINFKWHLAPHFFICHIFDFGLDNPFFPFPFVSFFDKSPPLLVPKKLTC